jgi:hypothetical protein
MIRFDAPVAARCRASSIALEVVEHEVGVRSHGAQVVPSARSRM